MNRAKLLLKETIRRLVNEDNQNGLAQAYVTGGGSTDELLVLRDAWIEQDGEDMANAKIVRLAMLKAKMKPGPIAPTSTGSIAFNLMGTHDDTSPEESDAKMSAVVANLEPFGPKLRRSVEMGWPSYSVQCNGFRFSLSANLSVFVNTTAARERD